MPFACHMYALIFCLYVLVCHSHVSRMYPYVTRLYSYVICMSLVCTRKSSVCHWYVLVCYRYVTPMYSYVIRMSLVCTHVLSVSHSYVLVCHLHVTRMYSYVIRMSLVYHPYVTHISSVCHSYALICHPYVTDIYSYVIRMSLVCTRISFVCYSYVICMSLVCTRMSFVCHSYVVLPRQFIWAFWMCSSFFFRSLYFSVLICLFISWMVLGFQIFISTFSLYFVSLLRFLNFSEILAYSFSIPHWSFFASREKIKSLSGLVFVMVSFFLWSWRTFEYLWELRFSDFWCKKMMSFPPSFLLCSGYLSYNSCVSC